jgi:hypothetical protein
VSLSTTVKQHDLYPPLEVYCTNGVDSDTGEPVPVDLTTATAVKVIAWRSNVLLFNRSVGVPTGPDALAGKVTMAWQAADVDTWADLYVEVEVTWPGAKPQTFPPEGWLVVHVVPDLG